MNNTKKLIEQSIMFAIDQLSHEIQTKDDKMEKAMNAQVIKTLAEAYDIVHRGKKGDC